MFKGSIGPGCLSLPFAVSTVGLWVAPGAMAVLMFCCVYNMFLMVKVKHELTARPATSFVQTYGDIGHVTFGPQGRRIVEIFVTLQQLGICTVYFSFASTNVRAFSLARSLSHTLTVVSAACRYLLPADRPVAPLFTVAVTNPQIRALLKDLGVSDAFTAHSALVVVACYPFISSLAQIRYWKTLAPLSALANVVRPFYACEDIYPPRGAGWRGRGVKSIPCW